MAMDRQKVVKSAEKMVARGRLEAAISEYRKVLEEAPNDTSTLNRVGDLYARLNRVSKATDLFRRTAENFARQGFFVKAIAIYKKIIRLDPTQIGAYENLAELYHRQGLSNDAIAQYQVVADYYAKHDDDAAAIGVYRSMVSIDSDNPSYRLRLATLHQDAGQSSEALAQYGAIARLMIRHGKLEEAAQVYLTGLEVEDGDPQFIADAVSALRGANHPSGAERMLRLALARNEEAATVARSLIRKREEAGLAEEPVEEGPEFEELWREGDEEVAETPIEDEEPAQDDVSPDGESIDVSELVETIEEVEAESEAELILDLDDPALGAEVTAGPVGTAEAEGKDEAVVLDLDDPALEDDSVEWLPSPPEPVVSTAPATVGAEEEPAEELADELDSAADLSFDLVIETEEEAEAESAGKDEIEVEKEPVAEVDEEEAEPVAVSEESDDADGDSRPTAIAAQIGELLKESGVLEKYEMHELAARCLESVLDLDPDHVEAQGRLIEIELDLGRRDEAMAQANRFAALARVAGEPEIWDRVVERMEGEGFGLEDGRFVSLVPDAPEPEEVPEEPVAEDATEEAREVEEATDSVEVEPIEEPSEPTEDEEAAEVEEVEEVAEVAVEEVTEVDGSDEVDEPAAIEQTGEIEQVEELEATAVVEETVETEQETEEEDEVAGEFDEEPVAPVEIPDWRAALATRDDEIESVLDQVAPTAEGSAPSPADPAALDLPEPLEPVEPLEAAAEVSATAPLVPPAGPDEPPTEEVSADEFFDLATELEAELFGEEEDDLLPPVQEQTIEEIVDGFRRGMEQSLSPEDFDTHYNLGVAYQEMGLLDEAVGEFQLAAKDPRYLVECCSLLAGCFLEKGYPELAVHWYEKGLESPRVGAEERLGLLYEVGTLEMEIGEVETARRRFLEIYGANSTYRDIVAKLAELQRAVE